MFILLHNATSNATHFVTKFIDILNTYVLTNVYYCIYNKVMDKLKCMHFRVTEDLKCDFDRTCKDYGVSASKTMRALMEAFIEGRVKIKISRI